MTVNIDESGKYRAYRATHSPMTLNDEFKRWILKQDDMMKWDMMDTAADKGHKWLFGRLLELFAVTPIEFGGLPHESLMARYVVINSEEQ